MAERTWTIREVLEWAARDFSSRGIESARLDAELLVAEALGTDRVGLYLDLNRPLVDGERDAIRPLVARRRALEPVAYILGHRDFYGRRFHVTPDVLIPRPDTETLIEHALLQIPADAPSKVIDVGTGSGVIAVTVAAERPLTEVTATDISEAALSVAAANATALGVADRVSFERVDLFHVGAYYDVVLSNPPYIPRADMNTLQADVKHHEPALALEAGGEGLDVIEALLEAGLGVTEHGARMLFEIGVDQAGPVEARVEASSGWQLVDVHPDLNRIPRVVHLRRI